MRLFIGLQPPLPVRQEIVSALSALPAQGVVWVPVENLHITLAFLGEVPEERVSDVQLAMQCLAGWTQLSLAISSRIGVFPNWRSPRVLWLGIEQAQALCAMQQRLTMELLQQGFTIDSRPYHPHLTIGRSKRPQAAATLDSWRSWQGSAHAVTIDKVTLFASHLRPGGPTYRILAQQPLQFK